MRYKRAKKLQIPVFGDLKARIKLQMKHFKTDMTGVLYF